MPLLNSRWDKWIWFFCFFLMSLYILYQHATSPLAIDFATQIDRQKHLILGNSEFFNPWQYRILSPFLLQGLIDIYQTVLPGKPEMVPYLFLSFIQKFIIFYISYFYMKALGIKNPFLILTGLLLMCYNIANSVFQADLSFNTYFDIIFYLLAGWLILTERYFWIIPVIILAALNRETSGLIIFMIAAAFIGTREGMSKNKWIITVVSLVSFAAIFMLIRSYYGYEEAKGIGGITSMKDYVKFNFTFFRMYPQLFGTLGIVPIIAILGFKRIPFVLKRWFWLIVPVWFFIHFVKSMAMETRLFLVPQVLIFIPAALLIIEGWSKETPINATEKSL